FWTEATRRLCRTRRLVLVLGVLLIISGMGRARLFRNSPGDFSYNPHWYMVHSCCRPWFHSLSFGDLTADDGAVRDLQPVHPRHGLVLEKRPTNVVLIVLESTPTCYLDLYGAPFPTTPCLRALQDRSVVFDNCYATDTHTIASALPLFGGTYND